jgi:hypothetical protein
MGRINWARVMVGRIVAESWSTFSSAPRHPDAVGWQEVEELRRRRRSCIHIVWSFVIRIATIWLYAAIQPAVGWVTALRRFRRLALRHATFSLATGSMQLLPQRLMILSALFSLPATLASTIAGAWIYRES